jgi:hypothetical protein
VGSEQQRRSTSHTHRLISLFGPAVVSAAAGLREGIFMMISEDRGREASAIAAEAIRLIGRTLQQDRNFQPSLAIQIALGRAGETIERLLNEGWAEHDRRLKRELIDRIRAVFKNSELRLGDE